ncbi:MAG: nitroreductase family protein [Prolixibacteraceae bacterium]
MDLEFLKTRRTIRKYSDQDIPSELINEILECGIRSSNTGNMQLYSIVVTRSADKKEMLEPLHFNQPMVKSAPVILTICFDLNRFKLWCEKSNTALDFSNLLWLLNGTIDASILAQTICVAAEANDLGICYLGTTLYNAPEISTVLNLPYGVIPITTLTLGYPEVIPELTDRLSVDAVIHSEEYQNYSSEKIEIIFQEKEKLESSKLFVAQNGKENLAQVFTEVRYKKTDSEYFSRKLKNMLTDQGFDL